jgi:hypothetical protein
MYTCASSGQLMVKMGALTIPACLHALIIDKVFQQLPIGLSLIPSIRNTAMDSSAFLEQSVHVDC